MVRTERKKWKGLVRRGLSCLLTLLIAVQVLPAASYATEGETSDPTVATIGGLFADSLAYLAESVNKLTNAWDPHLGVEGYVGGLDPIGDIKSPQENVEIAMGLEGKELSKLANEPIGNVIALEVNTGQVAGDGVVSFGLRYVDEKGFSHVEYVYPHLGDLEKSYRIAYEIGFDTVLKKNIEALGFSVEELISTYAAPLQPNRTDVYLVEPSYPVKEITGIEVFCAEEGSWDARGMRIYRVDSIAGLDIYGYISDSFFIRYTGVLLAEMGEDGAGRNEGRTLNWIDNTIFEITPENDALPLVVPSPTVWVQPDDGLSFAVTEMTEGITLGRRAAGYERALVKSTANETRYAFTFDFADVYGAGLESAAQPASQEQRYMDAGFMESLVIELLYNDVYGDVRKIELPVVTSVLGTMAERVPQAFAPNGIGQQGDKIAFFAYLPEFKSIEKMYLHVSAAAAPSLPGTYEESISLTSAAIYTADQISFRTVNDTTLVTETTGDPLYLFNSPSYLGELLQQGKHEISIFPYGTEGMPPVIPTRPRDNLYLVRLNSQDTALSEQPEEVFVAFRYVDLYGNRKETAPISVRQAAREFYGYWPSTTDDFSYEGLLTHPQGVEFMVELADVDYFTGLVLSSGSTANDWQLTNVEVARVEDYGPRVCLWQNIETRNAASNRTFSREVSSTQIFTMQETILVQPGESQEFDFVSNTTVQVPDYDWADIRYAMTYEQSCENLGFTKARETYTVEVSVAGNAAYDTGNGDSGSKNQFYFQLEFQEGSSGYVLANQQIGADGFRSGMKETFTITTNQDYGELVSVNIIPDDVTEDSQKYDKLNIDKILVRKNGGGSVNRQWMVENVGWIEIEYRDEAAGVSIGGQKGRTEAEITRSYPVSYQSYAVNLLFCIMTDEYGETGGSGAFKGTIDGTLNYYTTSGQTKDLTFNVIDLIYDYANKTPKTAMQDGREVIVSDPDMMFRPGHTDRFILSVDDVQKINSLTLDVMSLGQAGIANEGGTWNFSNISAAVITSDGVLQINMNDEYQRTNTTEPLATDAKVGTQGSYSMILPPGKVQTQRIHFMENEVKVDVENSTWVSTISREPASRNDEISVFVYPSAAASGEYRMNVAAVYTDVYGATYQTAAKDIYATEDENGNPLFMITGMGAARMSNLNSVTLHADGPGIFDAYIDYIIVQQVRSGVVINTYTMNCMNRNASEKFYVEPGVSAQENLDEQVLTFILGEETLDSNLVAEDRDIAVAIEYTTKNDPTGRRYLSRYAYLTDEGYNSISAGDMFSLTFREPYVDKIVGITFGATGGTAAEIDMAYIANYTTVYNGEGDEGSRKMTNWYSFANGATVNNSTAKALPTPNNPVYPLKFQFETAGASEANESGTNAPIRASISYKHVLGGTATLEIDDLRDYVTSSGSAFATSSITDVQMLVRNMVELRSITLEPYDSNPEVTQSWKVSKVTAVFVGDDDEEKKGEEETGTETEEEDFIKQKVILRNIPEGVVFTEGGDKYSINLSGVSVGLSAKGYNMSKGAYDQERNTTSFGVEIQILIDSESWVQLDRIEVDDSDKGYTITAAQLGEKSGATSDMSHLIQKVDDDTAMFYAPKVTGVNSQTFRITVASVEMPAITATILVEVRPEEGTATAGGEWQSGTVTPPAQQVEPEQDSGSTGDSTDSGSTGDSTGGGSTGDSTGGGSTGDSTGGGSTGDSTGGGSTGDSTGGGSTGDSTGGGSTGDSTGGGSTGDSAGGDSTDP